VRKYYAQDFSARLRQLLNPQPVQGRGERSRGSPGQTGGLCCTNSQGLPWWFVKHQYTPGMPWFYRAPTSPGPRQCRIAYWYPAQHWHTDQWGNTMTWVENTPQYVCD